MSLIYLLLAGHAAQHAAVITDQHEAERWITIAQRLTEQGGSRIKLPRRIGESNA
jgi:hypothetical protein